MSHLEFDVDKNSRAPGGLGSADNRRLPESDKSDGTVLLLSYGRESSVICRRPVRVASEVGTNIEQAAGGTHIY